ncbi:exportin-4-like [Rhopalosiphum maidis]|uniref:exportin-4-like n=1 Tax=Rhopalosiphum maidis TaxID=43146 RepID=UPI000EFFAC16|nr:exportin-4-like [Rhopalosiphum maidis]XP_026810151.1 exportin-4-like [Rhopalosiphum maidis]
MEQVQQILQELEDAGRIMLASPSLVTNDQRSAAEAVFMSFRKTNMPYSICRYILDCSKVDFVLFETAGTLRDALIRDWILLSQDQKNELRQYLFQFIMRDGNMAPFVRERILQVIAIMIKRGSVEDGGQERSNILDEVEKLIFNGDLKKQILGCSIILALMQEYSTTVKSTDVGLTWESHYSAKKEFEARDLRRIFIFSTRALHEIQNLPQPLSPDILTVLKHLLNICESVLVWGFISSNMPKYLIGMFEGIYNSENSPILKLGSDWKDIITNPSTVDLYFHIYWMVRDNPQFSHHCLNCLVQLSSINGNIWTDTNVRMKYMTNYLENFIKLVSTVKILDRESIGISTIIKRIISGYTPSGFIQFPPDLVKSFLENTTHLTCQFAEGAATEENLSQDDQMFFEAFNNILRPWVSIIANSNQSFPEQLCKSASIQILNTYIKCHISPPNGTKTPDNEFNENEEDDRVVNKEQLQYIGIFGRLIPEHSLSLLVTLIEGQIKEMRTIIEHVHSSGSCQWPESFQQKIDAVNEDIHWMFLIAGHILTVDSEGEPSMIPSEIMHHSIEQSKNVNLDLTMKFLTNQMLVMDVPGSAEAVDDVIKLVSIAFHLCELEKKLIEAKMESLCSPLLSGTIVWFLREFSQAYLMPNETYYNDLSMTLLQVFGQHTEAANWVLNYLLNKVEHNIKSPLYVDVSLIGDTVGLLISMVDIRHKAEIVINCEGFWKLFELQDHMREDQLVPEVKEGLYKAFSLAADAFIANDKQKDYCTRVITPTLEKFRRILSNDNFRKTYDNDAVRLEIMDILHKCIGMASGAVINTTPTIFAVLHPILNEFSALIGVYHNYQIIVHLIIQLFVEFSKKMLCFLRVEESDKFYMSCYQMVDMYARYNINRVSLDSDAEDQCYQDLYVFLELLTHVMSKEVLDLSSDGKTTTGKTAGDVCVYGLQVILPLMTIDLLKFPALCLQYYKYAGYMCEMVPLKLCIENVNIFKGVLTTIELGLTMFGHEITPMCTDFLQSAASFLYRHENCAMHEAYNLLKPFLKFLMKLILSCQINSDALSSTGHALYTLICCYPEEFQQISMQLINDQADASVIDRLHNAFTLLTAGIDFNGTHAMKCRFKNNFDSFTTNIRGFLFIK